METSTAASKGEAGYAPSQIIAEIAVIARDRAESEGQTLKGEAGLRAEPATTGADRCNQGKDQ
jgi:hypothetical protein